MKYENFKIVEKKHWNAMAIGLTMAVTVAFISVYYAYMAELDNTVLRDNLKFAISRHNDINHDLISANERIAELQSANETLIGMDLR